MGNLMLPGEFFDHDIGVGEPVFVYQAEGDIEGENAVAAFLHPLAIADNKVDWIALSRGELQDAVDFAGHSHGSSLGNFSGQ
jgi:hypothetical protein